MCNVMGVIEEKLDEGSNDAEPGVIAGGSPSRSSREVSMGASPKGLIDDDR